MGVGVGRDLITEGSLQVYLLREFVIYSHTNRTKHLSTDHLLYIGSQEKPIHEKTGLVWAFSFSEKPIQALCRGFHTEPISSRWSIRKFLDRCNLTSIFAKSPPGVSHLVPREFYYKIGSIVYLGLNTHFIFHFLFALLILQ